MTKTILALSAVLMLTASCGNNSNNSTSTTTKTGDSTTSSSNAAPAASNDPTVQEGLSLVAKNDCFTCHKINETLVGPAYAAVAAKYSPASDAIIDTLAHKVIRGGAGNWGTVPMTPHPQLSVDDAKKMVKYVLSLKQ
jgi:cytochrome c